MRLITGHSFLFLYFFVPLICFSQETKQNVFLQISAGNSSFMKPITATNTFSPGFEIDLIAGDKKDTTGMRFYFDAGIGYNYSVQKFDVLWAGTGPTKTVRDKFKTNEFLFSLGGIIQFDFSEKLAVNLLFGIQGSHSHTWTNDPNAIITMYSLSSSVPFEWGDPGIAFKTGSYNIVNRRQTPYKWEYLQFYLVTGVQLQYKVNNKISMLFGVKPRFVFYNEYLGYEFVEKVKLNYAPLKVMAQAAIRFKLFK